MTAVRWLPAGPATYHPGRLTLRQRACGRLFWTAAWYAVHRVTCKPGQATARRTP